MSTVTLLSWSSSNVRTLNIVMEPSSFEYNLTERNNRRFSLLSPFDHWDLVLITASYETLDRLFIFSRDEIPPEWYRPEPSDTFSKVVPELATQEYGDLHHIQTGSKRDFVRRLGTILDYHRKSSQVRPRSSREIEVLPTHPGQDQHDYRRGKGETRTQRTPPQARPRRVPRGLGQRWSPQEWEARQTDWLNREARYWLVMSTSRYIVSPLMLTVNLALSSF